MPISASENGVGHGAFRLEVYRTGLKAKRESAEVAVEVAKIEIKSVDDASGLEECIRSGRMKADEVVAVVGKTEGNGGVNDFTRILSDRAFRGVLMKLGTRSEDAVKQIPMVWSGGCDGIITPHATVFARRFVPAELTPEQIGEAQATEAAARR